MDILNYCKNKMEKAGDDIIKAVMKELRNADDYTVLEKLYYAEKNCKMNTSPGRKMYEAIEKEARRRNLI